MRDSDGPSLRYDPRRYGAFDEVRSERLRVAERYWRSKCNGEAPPLRAQIDPLDIPRLLPYLMLIEIVEGRFRYRLVGTQVAISAGYDFTGNYLDASKFANRDFYLGCYRDSMATRRPIFGFDDWVYPDGRNGVAEFGIMPLSIDGQAVSHFLTVEDSVEQER